MFVSRGSCLAGIIVAGVVTMQDVMVVVDAVTVSSSDNLAIVTQRYERTVVFSFVPTVMCDRGGRGRNTGCGNEPSSITYSNKRYYIPKTHSTSTLSMSNEVICIGS
jgi:hypothetical protein